MGDPVIHTATLDFLKRLKRNNNREWFARHKDEYLNARANVEAFADALLDRLNTHDTLETPSGKKSLFRIYRDVRFAKDKRPYNTHWSGAFRRATRRRRGGYYFRLEPGASVLVGGFWGPEPQDLKRIREDIAADLAAWQKMLSAKRLRSTFGGLGGEQVATAPRGYAKDHPAIELLRYRQFLLKHSFTDEEVCRKDFLRRADAVFRDLRPFFDFMSEVLTTDANGMPLPV
jgi:uncharacterized protein (TIGR02453 family)